MAGEWHLYEVSALIERGALVVGDGYRAKNEELSSHGLPFARAGNINDGFRFDDADHFPEENIERVGNKVSQSGDVVFTSKGTVGRFGFVRPDTPPFVYSPQLCFWRSLDPELMDPRFLFFWMFGREFFVQFKGVAGQTDMAEYVSLTDQRRMRITLPPLPEQRAIAHILGTLDDKIELNRRMNEMLEAMARALFKSWFVDFDPVRAKAAGRPPYLAPELWSLFPAALDDGDKPVGWENGVLEDVAEIIMGASPDGSTYNTDGIGVPLVNGPVEYGDFFLRRIKWTTSPSKLSKYGDLILCVRGSTTGRHAFADGEYCLGRGVAAIRAKDDQQEFVDHAVLGNLEELLQHTTGSVFPNLSSADIRGLRIVVPSAVVRCAFSKFARPLRKQEWANVQEAKTLAALRDTLLPKLISGELRVKDAERFIGRAG